MPIQCHHATWYQLRRTLDTTIYLEGLSYPKESVFLGVMFYFRIMECGTWSQLASTKRLDFMLICLSFSRDETSAHWFRVCALKKWTLIFSPLLQGVEGVDAISSILSPYPWYPRHWLNHCFLMTGRRVLCDRAVVTKQLCSFFIYQADESWSLLSTSNSPSIYKHIKMGGVVCDSNVRTVYSPGTILGPPALRKERPSLLSGQLVDCYNYINIVSVSHATPMSL